MRIATPHNDDLQMAAEPFVDFTSGYIQRVADRLPKQGAKRPWKLNQNYALDVLALRFGSVDDAMRFSNPPAAREAA